MKTMFEVIKYDGNNENLVYKYPVEDFNTMSQLVVQQAQEAIFYYKGQLADHFDVPGTYTLDTQNIPILRGLVNLPFGKQSPFHAVVYFVNKTEQMNNKWGVGDIPFVDKEYPIPLKTGVSGEYNFKIYDIGIFMNKLVGTLSEFNGGKVRDILDSFLKSRVVNHLAKIYQEKKIDLFVVESSIEDIAQELASKIKQDFYEYGVEITKFIITNIAKHEETAEFRRYYEFRTQQQALIDIENQAARARAEAKARMDISVIEQTTQQDLAARGIKVEADAMRHKREVEGYTYQQERGFDVAEKTAQNEGAGNFVAAGMGVGVGLGTVGAASSIGGLYADALSQATGFSNHPQKSTEEYRNINDDFEFIGNIGLEQNDLEKNKNNQIDFKKQLVELKEWFDAGLIDEEEYKQKKSEILNKI